MAREGRVERQIAVANEVIRQLHALVPEAFESAEDPVSSTQPLLSAILPKTSTPVSRVAPLRPEIPLALSALLVNGANQPRIGHEVERELAEAYAWWCLGLLEDGTAVDQAGLAGALGASRARVTQALGNNWSSNFP